METIVAVLIGVVIYLGLKVIALRVSLGGLIGYMAAKEYSIPTEEELSEWSRWYVESFFKI